MPALVAVNLRCLTSVALHVVVPAADAVLVL